MQSALVSLARAAVANMHGSYTVPQQHARVPSICMAHPPPQKSTSFLMLPEVLQGAAESDIRSGKRTRVAALPLS